MLALSHISFSSPAPSPTPPFVNCVSRALNFSPSLVLPKNKDVQRTGPVQPLPVLRFGHSLSCFYFLLFSSQPFLTSARTGVRGTSFVRVSIALVCPFLNAILQVRGFSVVFAPKCGLNLCRTPKRVGDFAIALSANVMILGSFSKLFLSPLSPFVMVFVSLHYPITLQKYFSLLAMARFRQNSLPPGLVF